ncbi:MAG: TIM barrel protein [Lentisphaeria bacterium]|jgi:UDP-N-acetyl-2-amino-2-deoxyglucuronate dehydrogenase
MYKSVFTDELSLDLEKSIVHLKEWGLQYCDLRSRIFQRAVEGLSDEQLHEVKALLDAHGMKVGCIQSSLAKVHLPNQERLDAEMRKLERIIRASEILDCNLVRSFFFWQPPKGQEQTLGELAVRPDLLAQVMEVFRPYAEKAKAAGLRLAFENCGCTKEECFKLLDAFDVQGWGFAWDPKNTWMTDKAERDKDLDAYLKRLAERTICLHVKSTGSIWFEDGAFEAIPYDKVFKALEDVGFDGPVSIETHNYDKSISDVEATKRVLAVVNKAWPTAAAGAQQEKSSIDAVTIRREWAENPVRFGVVGLGMGHTRAQEMVKTSGIKLVQVCDKRLDRCQRTAEACKVPYTQDYATMLANPEIEAVMVMNETGRHSELAMQALAAGKHALVTKPFEMTVAKCDQMIVLAKQKGLTLGVDHNRRLRPSLQSLRAAVENDYFGRPLAVSISLRIKREMPYFQENGGWRGTRELDGGVLSNQTVHHLDEIIFLFGLPEAVSCHTWTQNHAIEMEDLGIATWRYANGLVANVFATTCYPQATWYYQMELHGTAGAYIHREGGIESAPVTKFFKNGQWSKTAPYPRECEWLNSMDNFAKVIRQGGELLTSAAEGRQTVQVINAMYESAYKQDGAWVKL